ncbi:aminoacyl--tRNA ligase-related protein [Streptomyces albireticuli]|uniref:Aminoacyl-tRNA synthetase class II (G/ P/ S/T) domain-containing protein n=1 Tax=Streptomyces albireticuli TaxID=1940 RepID=A0A2A2DDA2_9ACTN|nr:aminoacyl--tRNA ligase-related protein [Streptomyces albireticuli]MCD9144989.1 hypothetical protein [Streptomyces albireticuli]MCD9164415.1 hypothetical protein [Streptomyces albireticuli]MCD9194126.1 hypothetical protein [Streptomyces albireticuli]PAU49416.1 hypothetical protein CK936_08160 [Streptomyces albireticuli]
MTVAPRHDTGITRTPGGGATDAVVILSPDETDLLLELDRTFTGWGRASGAREIQPPPVYPVRDLEKFDVYTNFPHLVFAGAALDLEGSRAPSEGRFARGDLQDARIGLSHATCYGAFLYYENARLAEDTSVTLVNRCFRHEDHFSGLRRLLSFQMREIVALGTPEHAQGVLSRFTERILAFADALSLKLEKVPATDPFFEKGGARALLAKVSPVKYEFQAGDLAISSVNNHRNFFGERCDIRHERDGEFVHTSCVAFGLERWLAVLLEQHGDDAPRALEAVRRASARVS